MIFQVKKDEKKPEEKKEPAKKPEEKKAEVKKEPEKKPEEKKPEVTNSDSRFFLCFLFCRTLLS